jgi:hypothetical protein
MHTVSTDQLEAWIAMNSMQAEATIEAWRKAFNRYFAHINQMAPAYRAKERARSRQVTRRKQRRHW